MRYLSRSWLLTALGLLSLIPYLYAYQLQDLRQHTVEFEILFFAAFGLYILGSVLVLRGRPSASSPRTPALVEARAAEKQAARKGGGHPLLVVFAFAILFRAILLFTPPTLSDDLFRYVWDGRVQAHGINPYQHAPSSPSLADLRDAAIYPHINRRDYQTIYPAAAELAFASIWRIVPDNIRWFQIVMATADLLAGGLLVLLLRAMGKPEGFALLYLWSPLVIFETAHSAHIDALVLPVLVAAWLARVKGRDGWVGALLGLATALKLYPALLLPALWRRRDDQGRLRPAWQMPLAFAAGLAFPYLPFLLRGGSVVGFLAGYFDERFNMGLAGIITSYLDATSNETVRAIVRNAGSDQRVINMLLLGILALTGLALLLRPASDGGEAVRRSIWIIGAFILLTQDLFPWYVMWLVPLLAVSVQPGRLALKLDAWTGWFLFSGLVILSYTFFIVWKPVDWVPWVEFGPLYALLLIPLARRGLREFERLQLLTPLYPPLARGEEEGSAHLMSPEE